MITFTNKGTGITAQEGEGKRNLTYADLVLFCLNAGDKGKTINEMKLLISISEKLDVIKSDENAVAEFNIDETKKIQDLELEMDGKWLMIHKDVISFSEHIRKLGN